MLVVLDMVVVFSWNNHRVAWLVRTTVVSSYIVRGAMVVGSMLGSTIGLSKLVQDRPRSLGVDGRYLSHHLAVVRVSAILQLLLVLGRCLGRTDLGRTGTSVWIIVLSLACSVWRGPVIIISDIVYVLVVHNPCFLESILKVFKSIPVALVQTVSSELLHFAIGDLLGFFYLLGVQLHLGRVDSSIACN